MGVLFSACCPPSDPGVAKSKEIDRLIEEQRYQSLAVENLLMLGTGECGKSTVVKQMKVIYADGFNSEDKEHYKAVIKDNLVRSMTAILQAMKNLGIVFEDDSLEKQSNLVRDFQSGFNARTDSIIPEIVSAIKHLWLDKNLQSCYLRSNEYQLIDSAKYFIEKVDEIAKASYQPIKDDIIRAREQTQGITEVTIGIRTKNHQGKFKIIDVGGQRAQRKKWIHAFEDVTAMIYVASLADYDLILQEDQRRGTNRMRESLTLFENTISLEIFRKKSIVLFLNKTDVFREKVTRSPIENYFSDYTGGPDYKRGADYFANQFLAKNAEAMRKIYIHFTCATDTEALQSVITVVSDTIIQRNLAEVGLK